MRRKVYKVIGNGIELDNGTIVRADEWGIEIDGALLSGNAAITYLRHQLHTQSDSLAVCECDICKTSK